MGLQLSDLILSATLFVNALAIVARKRTNRAQDAPPRDATARPSSSAAGDVGGGGGIGSEDPSGSMTDDGADDNDRDDGASEALLARTGDGSANAADGTDPEDASIAEQLASLLYWLRRYGIFIALWNTLVTVLAVLVFPS